ncbi:MAG TPA: hypothetical protein VJU78_05560 [Chitinophagaceae bacterium]|nr:hypothetical protein [Chitinophagaceae bacterium]
MLTYQTSLYKAILINFDFGWDAADEIFVSNLYECPTDAMQELNFMEPAHNNWFATMRTINDGVIIEEEWFDSSVIEFD